VVGWLGAGVEVEVEIPKGGVVKRRADGSLDYVSPLPAPFNYGFLPGFWGGDGDPQDAILLGPARQAGERVAARVYGVVGFVDQGAPDDKLVCGVAPPGRAERALVRAFFLVYPWLRRAVNRLRGKPGAVSVTGVWWWGGEEEASSGAGDVLGPGPAPAGRVGQRRG
jgi:inorganic pyrophosphatase